MKRKQISESHVNVNWDGKNKKLLQYSKNQKENNLILENAKEMY